MVKFFGLFIIALLLLPLRGEELYLADATGGAPLEAVFQASVNLAMADKLTVNMQRKLPEEALAAMDSGKFDGVIIDSGFVPNRETIPLAAEALALYISTANPGAKVSKLDVQEILSAPRPNWKKYNRLNFDIQRITMKPLTPSGTLIRRIFGDKVPAEEIFSVDSYSSGFAFINTASIFFAQYIPQAPVEVKCMPVNGVMPTSADIVSGKYPLTVKYVIACQKKSAGLEILLNELGKEKYRRQMTGSGLIVLLPHK